MAASKHLTTAAFSNHFYAIKGAPNVDARNSAVKRAKRAGASMAQMVEATGLALSTIKRIIK